MDLTGQAPGIASFHRLRSQAAHVEIAGRTIIVASLADIAKIETRRTAHQSSRCAMSSNERSQKKTPRPTTKRQLALEAMRQASENELTAFIRRQLALPVNQRTSVLRLPNGGSCL
jgi:ribosomal protein L14E/L6E/L27E